MGGTGRNHGLRRRSPVMDKSESRSVGEPLRKSGSRHFVEMVPDTSGKWSHALREMGFSRWKTHGPESRRFGAQACFPFDASTKILPQRRNSRMRRDVPAVRKTAICLWQNHGMNPSAAWRPMESRIVEKNVRRGLANRFAARGPPPFGRGDSPLENGVWAVRRMPSPGRAPTAWNSSGQGKRKSAVSLAPRLRKSISRCRITA